MTSTNKDDRLIPLTHLAFIPLAIFTMIFGPMLYLFPDRTAQYRAWVAAGYTLGAFKSYSFLAWQPGPFVFGLFFFFERQRRAAIHS